MGKAELLAAFEVDGNKYNIYGRFDIEESSEFDISSTLMKKIKFNHPEFYDITAKKVTDGVEEDYTPTGETWLGRKYVPADMIQFLVSALTRGDNNYKSFYLNKKLQDVVKEYTNYEMIATTVNNIPVNKRVLSNNMYDLYQLMLVTNTYAYYVKDDAILMISIEDHSIVSDNYFAEVGYWDSIQNIDNNTETLIWGELPEAV